MKTKTYNSKEVSEIFELQIIDKPLSNTIAGQLCKKSIINTLKESGVEAYSDKDFNNVIFRSLQVTTFLAFGLRSLQAARSTRASRASRRKERK